MSGGIFGGGAQQKKMAHPLSLRGLGLGSLEFCPSPCSTVEPEVKRYQTMMNTDLARLKYNQVAVDGKLGKGTCGLNMFFSQVPELFNTSRASWDDDLAFKIHTVCNGKPYALPSPVTKKNSVFAPDDKDPVCKSQSLPWGSSSMQDPHGTGTITTRTNELNMQLNELGYEPISSSVLDAETCGAMKFIDAANNTNYLCQPGFNCKAFTPPKKKVTSVPVATPTPVTQPVATTAPKTKQASMATTGLILGAVGVGLYALNRHFHWLG